MSGCCGIDPIHHMGIYIPHSLSRSVPLYFLSLFLSFPELPHSRTFPLFWGMLAATFLTAHALSPSTSSFPSRRQPPTKSNGHCLRVKSQPHQPTLKNVYFSSYCLHIQDSNVLRRGHFKMHTRSLLYSSQEDATSEFAIHVVNTLIICKTMYICKNWVIQKYYEEVG